MRIENDAYYTPASVAQQVFDHLMPFVCKSPKTVLDPACGGLALLTPAYYKYEKARIIGIDVSAVSPNIEIDAYQADFLDENLTLESISCREKVDLIVTNPPYSQAIDFLEKSLTFAKTVVSLHRLDFLASKKRHAFFQKNIPSIVSVLPQRPSFVGKGTDRYDYCWIVLNGGGNRITDLMWMPIKDNKNT